MIDVLGRKGFLIKPGTARAQAAVAINSMSRYDFKIAQFFALLPSFTSDDIYQTVCIGSFFLKKKRMILVNRRINSRMIDVSSDQ